MVVSSHPLGLALVLELQGLALVLATGSIKR